MTRRRPGRVEATVRRQLVGRLDEPLAQMAVRLARILDEGTSVSTAATTSRELRQLLVTLDVVGTPSRSGPPPPEEGDDSAPAAGVSTLDRLREQRQQREAGGA